MGAKLTIDTRQARDCASHHTLCLAHAVMRERHSAACGQAAYNIQPAVREAKEDA